jgi:hypothetical protein
MEDVILSILAKTPTDQYRIFEQIRNATMSEITKALATLEKQKAIHVLGYRKSKRTGLEIPIYSLGAPRYADKLDVHPLVAGVTSERLVEYGFVSRNLLPRKNHFRILEIGSAGSTLASSIRAFGGGAFHVVGIDLAKEGCDTRMDARSTGFREETFDQVISISTIEHIGLCCGISDKDGDSKTIQEIGRILKIGGLAIISVPYCKNADVRQGYRIYDSNSLSKLASPLSIVKKEFFCYRSGRWKRCSQEKAIMASPSAIPSGFHSGACACLLLKKEH